MKIKNRNYTITKITKIILLCIYYGFLTHLPASGSIYGGRLFKKLRYQCCRHIFKRCGKNINIERKASFGSGIGLFISS